MVNAIIGPSLCCTRRTETNIHHQVTSNLIHSLSTKTAIERRDRRSLFPMNNNKREKMYYREKPSASQEGISGNNNNNIDINDGDNNNDNNNATATITPQSLA